MTSIHIIGVVERDRPSPSKEADCCECPLVSSTLNGIINCAWRYVVRMKRELTRSSIRDTVKLVYLVGLIVNTGDSHSFLVEW